MIIVSSRKDFDDPDHISISERHLVAEIDLANDKKGRNLSVTNLENELNNKKVLMLVHGYNNEQFEVYDAYQIIEKRIQNSIPDIYDYIIGYSWPGGDSRLEWWDGKRRANSVARIFRFLIEKLSNSANTLDLMSHSLGARVVLKALKESSLNNTIGNYYCTAPAVDNECLEPQEEFFDSISSCKRLFVFHSARDGVLRIAYKAAERDRALGLYGPEDQEYILNETDNIYVANCKKRVSKHGDYKRCEQLYQYIGEFQSSNPPKFRRL